MSDQQAIVDQVFLDYHGITIEKKGNQVVIRKPFQDFSFLLFTSNLAIIAGFLLMITSGRVGLSLATGAIGIILRALKTKEQEDFNKITIDPEKISIINVRQGFRSKWINLSEIAELKTNVSKKHTKKFIGNISIITDNKRHYDFIELEGEDEEELEEDLILFSEYIINNFLNDNLSKEEDNNFNS